jgi:hypothetical protein
MNNSTRVVVACGVLAFLFSPPALRCVLADPIVGGSPAGVAQKDPKAEAAARKKAITAVNEAIAALAKEYESHANDSSVPIRDKSSYFKDNPAPELTTDVVLDGLDRVDGPIAEACYVKWQLLSGLPAKADDQLAPRIGDLYANAPAPIPNPSLTSTEKAQLDSQTMRMTEDQEQTVNDAWTKHVADWAAVNAPILDYSEALYGMLPQGVGATTLGLQDAYQRRLAVGVDSDVFINEVISDTRNWAVSAPPEQLRAVADQIARWIRVYDTSFPPPVYRSVKWDDKTHRLAWQAQPTTAVPAATLTDFRKFLIDQADQPGGGLKLKTDN